MGTFSERGERDLAFGSSSEAITPIRHSHLPEPLLSSGRFLGHRSQVLWIFGVRK